IMTTVDPVVKYYNRCRYWARQPRRREEEGAYPQLSCWAEFGSAIFITGHSAPARRKHESESSGTIAAPFRKADCAAWSAKKNATGLSNTDHGSAKRVKRHPELTPWRHPILTPWLGRYGLSR